MELLEPMSDELGPDELKRRFLQDVVAFCEEYPELAPRVVDAASFGVSAAVQRATTRAADMETCVVLLLGDKFDGHSALIAGSLLRRHAADCTYNFAPYEAKLRQLTEPTANVEDT